MCVSVAMSERGYLIALQLLAKSTSRLDIVQKMGLSLVLVLTAVLSASEAEFLNPLSDDLNHFSSALFEQIVRRNEGQTFIVTPFSVSTDLLILLLGSKGETRDELEKVLAVKGLITPTDDLNVHRLYKGVSMNSKDSIDFCYCDQPHDLCSRSS